MKPRPNTTAKRHLLCREDSLPEGAARGFRIEIRDGPLAVVLLRRNGRCLAYINRCPHTGVNLDWVPDRFWDSSGDFLQCATHGALFRPRDGFCVHGPCAGQSLQALAVYRHRGQVGIIL